ncbi:MAG: hypothetical protein AAB621_03455 [Patescibacteria group bacterium]
MNQDKSEKEILAKRVIFRANSGLHFLDQCLTHIHRGGTDAAFSRSLYILLSFNFELILKSRLLLASNQIKREDLIKEIKSHNLEELSKKLSENELNDINIKSIKKREDSGFTEYLVEMDNGNNIILQDLIDIRYDFEKDNLRKIDPNEADRMQNEIEILFEVAKKIMKIVE